MMSILVIPILAPRRPRIAGRWWIQFVGYIPFVAVSIVASSARVL